MADPSKRKQGKLSVEVLLEKGLALHRAGDVDGAERFYLQVLHRAPATATAWYLRSVIAMGAKHYERAAELLERAVRNAPDNGRFLCNLGEAYRRSGRVDDSLGVLRRAAAAEPDLAAAHYNLGLTQRDRGRFDEAIASFERVLSLDADLPGLGRELIAAWSAAGRDDLAIVAYERFRGVLRDEASLRVAVANIYVENGLLDKADEHFARALELDPESSDVHSSYAVALADGGEVERAVQHYRKALELEPGNRAAHGNLLFLLLFHPDLEGLAIRAEAEAFERSHVTGAFTITRHDNTPDPNRRLRIGYVSPDFRRHASAHFVLPLLRHHDRAQFDVFCYSNARGPDALTDAFREQAGTFRDVRPLDDDTVANCIRADRIDILVDLAMHTANSRLMVFARKPAPVQVCYLAYLGTTGLAAMDYRITAPGLETPDEHRAWFRERPMSLDDVYWCYDPLAVGPAVSELPAERSGAITFGSLNAFRKFNATTVSLWASVLRAVPASRLLLHAPVGKPVERSRTLFEKEGIAVDRLEFVGRMNREEYLAAYSRIDIGLDSVPYCGGTTSLDAYWMGVPVVTRVGRTAAGRAGCSISRALGLHELAAANDEEFVAAAARLAADVGRLAALRKELRLRLERSPFMDAPRFARSFERACRTVWIEWCRQDGCADPARGATFESIPLP